MEIRIQQWLKKLHRQRLEPGQIAELEAHLRDTIDELLIKGYSEEEAFTEAEQRVGNLKTIAKQEWNVNGKKERKAMMPAFVPMYFTQAWRQLHRNKTSTFITLSGLIAGLTACLLLTVYVKFETSYDTFHPDADRIYRLISYNAAAEEPSVMAHQNMDLAIQEHIPGIEAITSIGQLPLHPVLSSDKNIAELSFLIADQGFNTVFGFHQINGDTLYLDRPNTAYLTESAAYRLFGTASPIGQTIQLQSTPFAFEVIGIIHDLPGNTHFDFDVLVPPLGALQTSNSGTIRWGTTPNSVYIRLQEGIAAEDVSRQISQLPGERPESFQAFRAELQPITDIHLNTALPNVFKPHGDAKTLRLFSVIAFIILAIACINVALIAFVEYIKRIREIGMRKVLGADTVSIALQFLSEHLLKILIPIPVSLILTWLLLPQLSVILNKELGSSLAPHSTVILAVTLIVTIVIILSGVIPAILMYRNQNRASLVGAYVSGRTTWLLRQTAVVLQFGMCVFLMLYLLGIGGQLRFLQNVDLGYNPENLIRVDAASIRENSAAFIDRVSALPEVEIISKTSWHPSHSIHLQRYDSLKNEPFTLRIVSADHNTLQALEIPMLSGLPITAEMATTDIVRIGNSGSADHADGITTPPVLVSASYLQRFAHRNLAQGSFIQDPHGRIIGVFSDYNHASLHAKQEPVAFVHHSFADAFLIRYKSDSEAALLKKLQDLHLELSGGHPMRFEFIENILAAYYDADQRQVRLVAIAIGIALTLSLMGLFGMVAFNLERRTKEIGIRKVLGAGIPRLIWLLTRDVYALVALGTVMASPFALQLLNSWLEQYAYRIEPGWGLVLLALLVTSAVVATLVIWQAGRAALENPVKALRSE